MVLLINNVICYAFRSMNVVALDPDPVMVIRKCNHFNTSNKYWKILD